MALNHHKCTDKWWETEYSNAIHTYLKYREIKWRMSSRLIYMARSPQIHMRPVLLKTIKSLAKEHKMSNVCVHLAVLLLDFFMDNHCLKFDTILLITFACLTIAAKIEEHGSFIPALSSMHSCCVTKPISKTTFRNIEMKILSFFNFNVTVPTVAHFIEFYKEHFYYDKYYYNHKVPDELKSKLDDMILFYQDVSLENIKFLSYNPSRVAASIVLVCRHHLGLTPYWTAQLRKVTGYLKKDLVECCLLLGCKVMQHRKSLQIDEGYYSSSPVFESPIITMTKKKRNHTDVPNIIAPKRIAF